MRIVQKKFSSSNYSFSQKMFFSVQRQLFFIPLLIILVTIFVYWQVHAFDFINFDDNTYIIENNNINIGFSLKGVEWAFDPSKTDDKTYWHPLTWLSHMLDCQLFGMNPGPHHLVNLLLHLFNAVFLFITFYLMTGAIWQCGFLAALFALHPINVDSVAWIAERKNLLSTTFWMLTLLAYVYYARKQTILRYLLVFSALTLGLLAKPMLVVLPCVMLLLDFWPLGRINLGQTPANIHSGLCRGMHPSGLTWLVLEKIPLLLPSFITIAVTVFTLQTKKLLIAQTSVPMNLRVGNAIVSYLVYLWKMIWPTKLSIYYPFPETIPIWQPVGAAIIIIAITVLIFLMARQYPWLVTGWLWYLGCLIPVIGLVQGGVWPALADRWAYVPLIGIFILIAWGMPALTKFLPHPKACLMTVSTAILCILSVLTWKQVGHWRNSVTLFSYVIQIKPDNILAHLNLGEALSKKGNLIQALPHYEFILKKNPRHYNALINMGMALMNMEKIEEAITYFNQALKIKPDDSKALRLTGYAMADMGKYEQAIQYYNQALTTDPSNSELYFLLGVAYNALQKQTLAAQYYQKAIELKPDNTLASINLGNIYYRSGRLDLAENIYLYALQHEPDNPDVLSKLGAVVLGLGHPDNALKFFNQALEIRPGHQESQKGLDTVLRIMQNKTK